MQTAAAHHDVGKLINTLMGFDQITYPGSTGFQIPPEFDFVRNAGVEPFQMFVLPFSHHFDKQDLVDMYQGIMPEIGNHLEKVVQKLTIRPRFLPPQLSKLVPKYYKSDGTLQNLADLAGFLSPEFLFEFNNHEIEHSNSHIFGQPLAALPADFNASVEFYKNLRFMVFKVKQMAEKDYDFYKRAQIAKSIVANRTIKHPMHNPSGGNFFILRGDYENPQTNKAASQIYGANWPYDYFSLIETIKIDIGLEVDR